MPGSRIPLHGRSKTRIFIDQSSHFANLDGTAHRYQLHMRIYLSLFLNILFRFDRQMGTGSDQNKVSCVPAHGIRNADAFISSSERSHVRLLFHFISAGCHFTPIIKRFFDRNINHSKTGIPFYQRNIDSKLSILFYKFLCAIQGIDYPQRIPFRPYLIWQMLFLTQYRIVCFL